MVRLASLVISLLALGAAVSATPRGSAAASGGAVGIDVSRFNGGIGWTRVAASGVEFAFVAASRGSGDDCTVKPRRCGADPMYERNSERASATGIRVGAYHRGFANGDGRAEVRQDARAEADLFISRVGGLRRGDLLPVLDVETPFGGLDPGELRLWVGTWLDRVRDRLGRRPIVYTNITSWRATEDTRQFAREGHHLWVAHWQVSEPSVPAGNWNGRGWAVWQFTNSGRVKGIRGRVDMDRVRSGFGKILVR
ncbi:MAG: glycoside hydrolase family 25 protein [Actinomycetota bacterium]